MGYRTMGRAHAGLARMAARGRAGLAGTVARGRAVCGQGTVEYVALILLVAVVLAGVVAATRKSSIGDGGIARTIVTKLKAALDSVK